MSGAFPMKNIGEFPDPFIGNPLGAKKDRTSAMKHGHVGSTTPPDIVPKHSRSFGGRHCHAQPGKSSVTSSGNFRKVEHERGHSVTGDVHSMFPLHIDNRFVSRFFVHVHGILVTAVMPTNPIVGNLDITYKDNAILSPGVIVIYSHQFAT